MSNAVSEPLLAQLRPKIEKKVEKHMMITKLSIKMALKNQFDDPKYCANHNRVLQSKYVEWRRVELVYTFLSILCLFFAITEYEMALFNDGFKGISLLNGDVEKGSGEYKLSIKYRKEVQYSSAFRYGMLFCSVISIILLHYRNILIITWKKNYYNKQLQRESLDSSTNDFTTLDYSESVQFASTVKNIKQKQAFEGGNEECTTHDESYDESFDIKNETLFTQEYFAEMFIQCIFPWPHFYQQFFMQQLAPASVNNVVYFISDLFIVFMFVRVYFVVRHMERYHEFTDVYSKKIFKSVYGIEQDGLFVLKYEITYNPTRATLYLFSVSILILSQILRIFELPYEFNNAVNTNLYQDYGSAIWCIVITSTTVGYGDSYPKTIGGQITCIVTAFWGTFIISLLVLVIANVFTFEDHESKAIRDITRRRSAANAIKRAYQFNLQKKKFYLLRLQSDPEFQVSHSTYLTLYKQQLSKDNMNISQTSEVSYALKKQIENKVASSKVMNETDEKELRALGLKMNQCYVDLCISLKEFYASKEDFEKLVSEAQQDILNLSRVTKKEVLDMSDLMDQMSKMMLQQSEQIKIQTKELNKIKQLIPGGDEIEDLKVDKIEQSKLDSEDKIPELFSLRRSPFYQTKIIQRQLDHKILNTNTELKQLVTKEAKKYILQTEGKN